MGRRWRELRRTRYDRDEGFGGGGGTIDTLDQVGPAVARVCIGRAVLTNERAWSAVAAPLQISGKKGDAY